MKPVSVTAQKKQQKKKSHPMEIHRCTKLKTIAIEM